MSPQPTVQRTLVKSPPELWAEVSDAAALARHLGEFGEIRITRLEPETTVVWEGERASGTVELEKSGWGTKVTLTATPAPLTDSERAQAAYAAAQRASVEREKAEAERRKAEERAARERAEAEELAAERAEADRLAAEKLAAERVAAERAEAETLAAERAAADKAAAERAAAEMQAAAAAPRPGLFTRLFGKKDPPTRTPSSGHFGPHSDANCPLDDPEPRVEPEPEVADPEPATPAVAPVPDLPDERDDEPLPDPTPLAPRPPADPGPPAAAEAAPALALADEKVLALLNGVLDDLGSAHHRPFSR
jgi:hypothetical protein